jgi:hypothetical protein
MMSQVPLRTAKERLTFCEAYFTAVGAPVVYAADGYREYELPRDVDKELTDRPYYWMWVEQTHQEVQPTILRLAFTEDAFERENQRLREEARAEAEKQNLNDIQPMFFRPPTAELVTLGSFRLDKMYASLDKRGQFACVVPQSWKETSALVPWLMMNMTVSYRCDLVEQQFWSVGVCLSNGQIVERFYDIFRNISINPENPSRFADVKALTMVQAFQRGQTHVAQALAARPHDWAVSAQQRLERELQQVRLYYQSILPDVPDNEKPLVQAEQKRKERELAERSGPRIDIVVKQLALVGLMER